MQQQINQLGGFLAGFPIDLNKASQDEKLNYIATLVYGVSKDVAHLQDDFAALRQGQETMKRDAATTRMIAIIAISIAIGAFMLGGIALAVTLTAGG